jgi:tRNA(Ile)-lysidine synthase
MRLARGSGVEGLSAMAARRYVTPHRWRFRRLFRGRCDASGRAAPSPTRRVAGVPAFRGFYVIRPLLNERREDLRHYVRTLGSVRRRPVERGSEVRAGPGAGRLGGDRDRHATLAATAAAPRPGPGGTGARAVEVAERVVRTDIHGVLRIDRDGFARSNATRSYAFSPPRCNGSAARNTGRAPRRWRPARPGVGRRWRNAPRRAGRGDAGQIEVFREYAAVAKSTCRRAPQLWDGRWKLDRADVAGMTFARWAMRDGRNFPTPGPRWPRHAIARALPRSSTGTDLVACPVLHHGRGVRRAPPAAGTFSCPAKSALKSPRPSLS